jgi:hypothetical protein
MVLALMAPPPVQRHEVGAGCSAGTDPPVFLVREPEQSKRTFASASRGAPGRASGALAFGTRRQHEHDQHGERSGARSGEHLLAAAYSDPSCASVLSARRARSIAEATAPSIFSIPSERSGLRPAGAGRRARTRAPADPLLEVLQVGEGGVDLSS